MFVPQFMQTLWRQCEFGGVWFTRQGYRRHNMPAVGFDIAFQVRQCAAHPDKVVYQHVIPTLADRPIEVRLPCQSPKAIGPCMGHHIDLNYARIDRPLQHFAQLIRKDFRDGVDAFTFKGMCTDKRRYSITCNTAQVHRFLGIEGVKHQVCSCTVIPRLGRFVGRMLLDRRLAGVNQHVREVSPRGTRRFEWL